MPGNEAGWFGSLTGRLLTSQDSFKTWVNSQPVCPWYSACTHELFASRAVTLAVALGGSKTTCCSFGPGAVRRNVCRVVVAVQAGATVAAPVAPLATVALVRLVSPYSTKVTAWPAVVPGRLVCTLRTARPHSPRSRFSGAVVIDLSALSGAMLPGTVNGKDDAASSSRYCTVMAVLP